MNRPQILVLLAALVGFIRLAELAQATEPSWKGIEIGSHVAVKTTSGRVVRGAVDKRTTDQHLWLVAEVEGMWIGSCLSREAIDQIVSSTAVVLPTLVPRQLAPAPVVPQPESSATPAPAGNARSLVVFAQLENWDQDAEFDGLGLYLLPCDAAGNLVAVTGFVNANLTTYRGDARSTRGAIDTEESWAVQVSAKNYSQKGGYVQLPFRTLRPESDMSLQPVADLQVRLNIAGHGTLDGKMENVVIRPYSATGELRTLRSRARP